jgi:hypothetical protein
MRVRGFLSLLALPALCLLAAPRAALGQDLAAAEALFKKGVADLDAGKYETACPALAESQRLDPRPGTLFAVADCRDKQGQIATARALYEDYLRAVEQMTTSLKLRHHDRAKTAKSRRDTLAVEVPELTLTLPAGAPAEVKVTRDGVVFSKATFGIGLPVDPGEHVIKVQVGDGPIHEQRVTLQKRERKTVELQLGPKLAPEPAKAATATATAAAPPPTAAPSQVASNKGPAAGPTATAGQTAPPPSAGLGGRKIAALAVGGVGLAGIGLGAAMGAMALDKKGIIDAHCPDRKCDAEGSKALQDAQIPGLVSTIGFGVGAAGVAAAVVLWVTAPSGAAPGGAPERKGTTPGGKITGDVEIGPQGASFRVQGSF